MLNRSATTESIILTGISAGYGCLFPRFLLNIFLSLLRRCLCLKTSTDETCGFGKFIPHFCFGGEWLSSSSGRLFALASID